MYKKDHIVIPKCILKQFADEKNNKIASLNLLTKEIKYRTLNSVFTEKGYYDVDVDDFIQKTDETIIGKIRIQLSNELNNNNSLSMSENLIRLMKNIFILQNFRNNYFTTKITKSDGYFRKYTHNELLRNIIKCIENDQCEDIFIKNMFFEINKQYENMTPSFLKIENTNRSFLLPASQISFIKVVDYSAYIFPIAPDIALIWKYLCKEEMNYRILEDSKTIEKLNNLFIKNELEKNVDCLVFGKTYEINKMRDFISI